MANSEVNSNSSGSSIAQLIELKRYNKKVLIVEFRKRRVQVKLGWRIRFRLSKKVK